MKAKILSLALTLGVFFAGISIAVGNENCGSHKNISNHPNPAMCSDHIAMMKSFVGNLKNGEIDEVIKRIAYPIKFWNKGEQIGVINNPEQFKRYYDFIFPKKVINDISTAFSNDKKFFWNYRGTMFGDGAVWFYKESGKVKTINLADDNLVKEMMIQIKKVEK